MRKLNKFLFNIYGYTFFTSFLLLAPIYTIFMQKNGVSDFGLSILLIIWVVGVLSSQFLVSKISAKYGSRLTMIFGQVLLVVGYFLWVIYPTYTGFAIGMFLSGIQAAIYNVVPESMIYNFVETNGQEKNYERIIGNKRNIALIGNGLSMLGSLLFVYGYNFITALSVFSLFVSCIFVLQLPNTKKDISDKECVCRFSDFRDGLKILRSNRAFLVFLLLNVLVINLTFLNDFLPVIGTEIQIPTKYIGVFPLFLLFGHMIGYATAHYFAKISNKLIFLFILLGGILFLLFGLKYSIISILFLWFGYVIFGVVKILLYSRFQKTLHRSQRLVGLSFYNFINQLFYGFTCLLLGWGGTLGSWRYGIIILGVCIILLGLLPAIFYNRK
ncbi:MAG: MFS transporter [Alphaproteobacteria bacterium]